MHVAGWWCVRSTPAPSTPTWRSRSVLAHATCPMSAATRSRSTPMSSCSAREGLPRATVPPRGVVLTALPGRLPAVGREERERGISKVLGHTRVGAGQKQVYRSARPHSCWGRTEKVYRSARPHACWGRRGSNPRMFKAASTRQAKCKAASARLLGQEVK